MKFKGAIFDLDGTLVDSIEDLADSMNSVLKENHLPEHDLQSYKYFVGNGIKTLVRRAVPESSTDELVNRCYVSMMEIYTRDCAKKSKPYKDIPELLKELHRRGLRMSVLSNKADNLTKKIVATLFPETPFVNVYGLQDEITRKPNPEIALRICGNMDATPEEMLYFGDTDVDMETAARAGFFAVGVLWGFREKEELLASGADCIIESPCEIFESIDL